MNILFISPTYRKSENSGPRGGGEISNILLLEWLASKGHHVTVLAQDTGGIRRRTINGVYVIGSKNSGQSGFSAFLKLLEFKKNLREIYLELNPEVIICATDCLPYALSLGEACNSPVGVFIRAYENFVEFSSFKKRIKSTLLGDFFESGLSKANFLIPNSSYMDEVVKQRVLGVDTHVVYPPIEFDTDKMLCPASKDKFITMVGTSEKKGIQIFVRLAEDFPDLKFKIIGTPKGSKIKDKKNLEVTGWCDAVEEFSLNSQLVLVPSLWNEPFGRVAVEAIMCGVPVMVSNKGGLPEAVSFNPKRVVDGEYEEWFKKLFDYSKNNDKYKVLSHEADVAKNKYSLDFQGENLESLLQEYARR